jgi:hypothetical protein
MPGAHSADECRFHALHCIQVADHARTVEDRSDFLAFAETWYKLANEIDSSDRLIAFIDGLGVSEPMTEKAESEIESGLRSLRRLTAAIVAVSACLMTGPFAAGDHDVLIENR